MDDLFLCLNIGRLNIKNRLPNIGIKDIFECFMMVLNYHKAQEFVFYSYSKMVTLKFWSK